MVLFILALPIFLLCQSNIFIHFQSGKPDMFSIDSTAKITFPTGTMLLVGPNTSYPISTIHKINFTDNTLSITDDIPNLPNSSPSIYPNPFNPSTNISFNLPTKCLVVASIFDIRGNLVIELANSYFLPGKHNIVWNAVDALNKTVSSGVFILRLRFKNKVAIAKLTFIK